MDAHLTVGLVSVIALDDKTKSPEFSFSGDFAFISNQSGYQLKPGQPTVQGFQPTAVSAYIPHDKL